METAYNSTFVCKLAMQGWFLQHEPPQFEWQGNAARSPRRRLIWAKRLQIDEHGARQPSAHQTNIPRRHLAPSEHSYSLRGQMFDKTWLTSPRHTKPSQSPALLSTEFNQWFMGAFAGLPSRLSPTSDKCSRCSRVGHACELSYSKSVSSCGPSGSAPFRNRRITTVSGFQ